MKTKRLTSTKPLGSRKKCLTIGNKDKKKASNLFMPRKIAYLCQIKLMETAMEILLHFTWKHRLCPTPLLTTDGEEVEVIDPGLHNHDSGPDFLNARLKINGMSWAGSVEVHDRASDWYRHRHDKDTAYDNTILHVVGVYDTEILTSSGRKVPQVVVPVPEVIERNYAELQQEEHYPPCYRIIPDLPELTKHAWLSSLTTERLQQKTERIRDYLRLTGGDWERAFFIALARNFGFGVNAEAFEAWAMTIEPSQIGKHRDDLLQVEAFFFGQAGLLDNISPEHADDPYVKLLQREYAFLRNKFSLHPIASTRWKFLRMRPQNFPHIRLAQFARLYHEGNADFSKLLTQPDADRLREMFTVAPSDYWQKHYTFSAPSPKSIKTLRTDTIDLLLINAVAPLLFAYGRDRMDESLCNRAFDLLEGIRAENNHITRTWAEVSIRAANAADSQALIQLKTAYCDRRDCLRCRFGAEYLRRRKAL